MNKKKETSRKISLRQKFGYWFDNVMAKGTISLVGILFVITLLVVIIAGILSVVFDGKSSSSLLGGVWVSLMHAIDAGTLTADAGSFPFMLLMTIVTICGLFITSILIGIINTGIESKMSNLRKGKSCVLEEGHTVILGFNANVFTLLTELIEANANQKEGIVVIMDPHMEKEEMEDFIRQRIPDTKTTRIICRNGDISDFSDLQVCSPEYAKSIIINSTDDFVTIKSILATTNLLKNSSNTDAYIIGVIHNEENYEAAMIAGEGRTEVLFFEDTIARIIAHTCRQPGLSSVFTELFDYGGDEIYIEEVPQLVDKKMKDLNLYLESSTVLGIEKNGISHLAPSGEMLVEPGDKLILLAPDDNSSVVSQMKGSVNNGHINKSLYNSPEKKQKMLILGYGPRLEKILMEEDQYMAKGSEILLAIQDEYEEQISLLPTTTFKNITVDIRICDIYNKNELKKLLSGNPESVFVPNSLMDDAQYDDSKTLLLLLQLRAISNQCQMKHTVTTEMRNIENQKLAQITEVKDFVVSSNITSLMVTQISQSRKLRGIFHELLTADGAEIYIRPAADYVSLDVPVTMYTASAACSHKNQVFMGYRKTDATGNSFDIITNPDKSETLTFNANDSFIVLAQN